MRGFGRRVAPLLVAAVCAGLLAVGALALPAAAATVPGAPTMIRNAIAGNGEATVSWTAPASDGGAAVTGYVVTPYVGYSPRPSTTFGSTDTTQTVIGLTNGTTYRFRVQAINAVGTSGFSTVTNPVTPQPTITVTPSTDLLDGQSVTVTGSGFSADVSIVGLAQCEGPDSCIGHTVVPASGGSFSATFTVSLLVLGTDCSDAPGRCALGASNLNGAGGVSVQGSLVPLSFATVPGAPTIIRNATAGNGEATVSWTAPASDGGAPITGYRVTPYVGYSPRPSVTCNSTATTGTVTGLTNGTTYRFKVAAINAVGTGPTSTVTNPVTPASTALAEAGSVELDPGARPAQLVAPGCVTALAPLVVLLHGYSSNAQVHNSYLGVTEQAASRGLYVLLPNGTREPAPSGKRFWDAMPACCNFTGTPVDDVSYLQALIEEAIAVRRVDPDRIYVFGHSNGGFMAYRLACELSHEVTAIAVLAGSDYETDADCQQPSRRPVSVLHLHGDDDELVDYEGGSAFGDTATSPYPGAVEVRNRWAARAGCDDEPVVRPNLIDLVPSIPGAETAVTAHTGCVEGIDVQLDTIEGGSHSPLFDENNQHERVGVNILDWLLAHAR